MRPVGMGTKAEVYTRFQRPDQHLRPAEWNRVPSNEVKVVRSEMILQNILR